MSGAAKAKVVVALLGRSRLWSRAMRYFSLALAFLAALILWPRPSHAGATEIQIHLLTMGPGDHLFTRAGHAALMVAEVEDGAPKQTTIYNYGETDWDNPYMMPQFLRGNLVFFLSETGSLFQTVNEYGVRQGRDVYRQRLNLSPEQAAEVARRLKEGTAVGKREYLFHHSRAVCSTRITDLLDDVLQGRIRAELAPQIAPMTRRDYHELILSGRYVSSMGADLFVGRLHDDAFNKYDSMSYPDDMRALLQTVLVPSPLSGANQRANQRADQRVPLAEPPVALVERKVPVVLQKSRATYIAWGAIIALLLGYGASAYRRAGTAPEEAAAVIVPAAIFSGIVGIIILAFMALSRVPEFRHNELILVFLPTDLWLAWRMRRFIKKRIALDAWVQGYAHLRLALAALAVVGHVIGVLYQKPRIVLVLGVLEAALIWVLIRALRGRAVQRAAVPIDAPSGG
jgi:hypothetical protein